MGGSGALICSFKNPGRFKSVSLLAPVCNVAKCPVFKEAYSLYLGGKPDDGTWDEWNPFALAKTYKGPKFEILLDQVMYIYLSLRLLFPP